MNEELVAMLNNHMKRVDRKVGLCIASVVIIGIIIISLQIYIYMEGSDDRYHLYMNTKTSLESIHNVRLDSYDGSFERKLTTEEMMTRKHLQRWHLRKLFK